MMQRGAGEKSLSPDAVAIVERAIFRVVHKADGIVSSGIPALLGPGKTAGGQRGIIVVPVRDPFSRKGNQRQIHLAN